MKYHEPKNPGTHQLSTFTYRGRFFLFGVRGVDVSREERYRKEWNKRGRVHFCICEEGERGVG